ncbi:uncharacterized protein LOC128953460 [Oppia nitens]|uniref:uncharacterized protein LOC128953460 n=1 Tax=Oppia nitens TaxID=1686743 RepID=UPI0023DC35F0|nr:uncharacterized protein LOC128953460 [Oppia nitens]
MGKTSDDSSAATTPICRCRVMYLGSAVPHITKDGLQGIQEPLRDLYPEHGLLGQAGGGGPVAGGIDSWLSVWSNGILVENVDDQGNEMKRFHPIESLHYCAAVRYVSVPRGGQHTNHIANGNNGTINTNTNNTFAAINGNSASSTLSSTIINGGGGIGASGGGGGDKVAKFLPLDSPFSRYANTSHPPLFACILRRTTGIKVLECHAFICKKEPAANALVRCCFHAYADTIHAKQIDTESPYEQLDRRRSRSISALDTVEKVEEWRNRSTSSSTTHDDIGAGDLIVHSSSSTTNGLHHHHMNGHTLTTTNGHGSRPRTPSATSIISHSPPHEEESNYKVWNGSAHLEREVVYHDGNATLRSMRSNSNTMMPMAVPKPPKPRQIAMPSNGPPPPLPSSLPPPPPLPMTTLMKGTKKSSKKQQAKESTLKKKHKYKGFMGPQSQHIPVPHHMIAANGYHTVMGPPPPHHMLSQSSPHAIYAAASSTLYSDGRRYATARRGPPPPMGGPPLPPPPPHHHMTGFIHDGYQQHPILLTGGGQHPDEPIYIQSSTMRPITPMTAANYAAVQHHHHQQQHHLDQQQPTYIIHNGHPYPLPPPPSEQHYGTVQRSSKYRDINSSQQQDMMDSSSRPSSSSKKKDKNNKGGSGSSEMESSSSPFNTGIYKKKGHLNERAFSYSIRQEHRSRSNSLTNLHFDTNNAQPDESSVLSSVMMNGHHNHHHHNGLDNGSSLSAQQINGGSAIHLTERELSDRLTALNMNNGQAMMNGGGGGAYTGGIGQQKLPLKAHCIVPSHGNL